MTEITKSLTEAQRNHLAALNAAFVQVKQRMDEFVAYLRAEHDTPAGGWMLRNLQVGFERAPEPQGELTRHRTKRKPKAAEVVTEEGKEDDAAND